MRRQFETTNRKFCGNWSCDASTATKEPLLRRTHSRSISPYRALTIGQEATLVGNPFTNLGKGMAQPNRVTTTTRVIGGLGGAFVGAVLCVIVMVGVKSATNWQVKLFLRDSLVCLVILGSVVGAVFPNVAKKMAYFFSFYIN